MNEQDFGGAEDGVDVTSVVQDIVTVGDVTVGDVTEAEVVVVEELEGDIDDIDDVLVLEVVDDALVLPVWEPTGVARVDEALDELTLLDPDDVHHHAEVYDAIHQRLRGTLSDLDTPV